MPTERSKSSFLRQPAARQSVVGSAQTTTASTAGTQFPPSPSRWGNDGRTLSRVARPSSFTTAQLPEGGHVLLSCTACSHPCGQFLQADSIGMPNIKGVATLEAIKLIHSYNEHRGHRHWPFQRSRLCRAAEIPSTQRSRFQSLIIASEFLPICCRSDLLVTSDSRWAVNWSTSPARKVRPL